MTSPRPPLPDAEARRIAVTDFGRNLVVVAGAGTGKTSLLVERVLNALGSGALEIERLAAITFTEKAAGELRTRLALGAESLRALARAEASPPAEPSERREADRAFNYLAHEAGVPAGRIAERALAALAGLERARIATIHAFCAEILREHPVEAGIPPDFTIDDEGLDAPLFASEWESFLADELRQGAPREALWLDVLESFPVDLVSSAAEALCGFGTPIEALEGGAGPDARALLGPAAAALRDRLRAILAEAPRSAGVAHAFAEDLAAALGAFTEGGIAALRASPATAACLERDDTPRGTRFTPDAYKEAADEARRLVRRLATVDEAAIGAAFRALAPFARRFRGACLRAGRVSFDALLVLARDLLRDHPPVRERLKRRFPMILVDEFQDTDPLQYEIVLFLGETEGGGARDAYRAVPAEGRLFVVGDPKQSIYRFRGADYEAFRRAIERIEPDAGRRLRLTANFRSAGALLGAVNTLFGDPRVWTTSRHQPDYQAIDAARPPSGAEPRVELWTVDPGADRGAGARRAAEGRAIAAGIAERVAGGEIAFGDVFLLMRAATDLAHYLRPLRERGIPFVVDGGKAFTRRAEVTQMIAALRALARPADPVALLAFLRSPAAGVPDAELAAYADAGGRWSWREEADPAGQPAVARAFRLLRELHREGLDLPADALVRRLVGRGGLLILGALGYEGAQRVANLRKLAAAAVAALRGGTRTLNEVLDALEAERGRDVEGEAPLADERTDAVRVMTVHRAKGLERPVVIVPDLARELQLGGRREDVETTAGLGAGGAALLGVRIGDRRNAAQAHLEREEELHREAEEIRTLYVALTRPRERLILLAGEPSKGEPPWLRALAAWGYDPSSPPDDGERIAGGAVLHRRIAPPPRPTRAPAAAAPAGEDAAVAAYGRALAAMRERARPPLVSPSGVREEWDARREGAVSAGAMRGLARPVGTVVHALLEGWDRGDEASLLAPLPIASRRVARAEAVDAAALEREARRILVAFLASGLPERLRRLDLLGREVPLLLDRGDGTAWRGSIDLLYRESGEVVVADYKTDLDEAEGPERYRDQLRVYAEAARRALALPAAPRTELWFLRSGRIVTL